MTPAEFIAKWKAVDLTERSAAQQHFLDLCELLGEPKPAEADPKGEWYAFEKGATKTGGGGGWADVWKRGHFGWEYKRKGSDLDKALRQLQQYALALENPPLLVVCDTDQIRVHTNWTNTVSRVHRIALDDLHDAAVRQTLKQVFSDPERLKPGITRQTMTEAAARKFAELAKDLRAQGHDPETVAHFVNRLVFAMFAEDVDLLPSKLFTRLLEASRADPDSFVDLAREVFDRMRTGGRIGLELVEWFNGGLFDSDEALPLGRTQIELVLEAANMDWSDIDPSIFGTLFERGLDPDKRSQLGAHYTDPEKIMLILDPVVVHPLTAEWTETRTRIEAEVAKAGKAKGGARTGAMNRAAALYRGFVDRLRAFRVLDPACGSGNFLYLALLALKDLEHRAGIEVEALGLQRELPAVGPESVKGIELNPYAAELARVSIWIGEIQWMRRNGFGVSKNPILKPLDTIECRDAILNPDGSEPEWPAADVIVGNPPFLGDKLMLSYLGESYVSSLRATYLDKLPGGSDLVCYWFAIADQMMLAGNVKRVGLVATNSIRGGANRKVLDRIRLRHTIFAAWSDLEWTIEGAAVRVSLVCFGDSGEMADKAVSLNGHKVGRILADLTDSGFDLTIAQRISENRGVCFIGRQKDGPVDIPEERARQWIGLAGNPNGRSNADVVKPFLNGSDLAGRSTNRWIIDFGVMSEAEACRYEAPFEYLHEHLKPLRENNRDRQRRELWWRPGRSGSEMRAALSAIKRYIATVRHSKHRTFSWVSACVVPDSALVAVARDDDTTFGVLHSRFHEAWSLRLCTWLGKGNDPRYTPSTTFETFPFPEGLTPNIPAADYSDDPRAVAIAEAARRLNEYRENWLNPPDWVVRVPDVVEGYPDRLLPKDPECAKALKKRTLTNLYNERPAWLANAHAELDAAVAAAYGWPADISEDEALERLLALNLERAAKG
jgi:type II restriction/modification system DNA methylase subunit YeeA